MSYWPRADGALVARLLAPEVEATALRLQRLRHFAPDAPPAEVHRFGPATALVCPALPELSFFNTVHGLTEAHADQLDAILSCYRRHGIRPHLALFPGQVGARMLGKLVDAGLRPGSWTSVLYRLPGTLEPPNSVPVRRLEADEGALFADLFMRGFGMAPEAQEQARHSISEWVTVDWWHCYAAEVDGQPAAMAILAIRDGVGYLAAAATLEEYRGRGCQSALIVRRVNDATAAGCDVLCVQTGFATQSQANQERFGFRLAATGMFWEEPRR